MRITALRVLLSLADACRTRRWAQCDDVAAPSRAGNAPIVQPQHALTQMEWPTRTMISALCVEAHGVIRRHAGLSLTPCRRALTCQASPYVRMCVRTLRIQGDATRDDVAFPKGMTDGNSDLAQQLDLRMTNRCVTPARASALRVPCCTPCACTIAVSLTSRRAYVSCVRILQLDAEARAGVHARDGGGARHQRSRSGAARRFRLWTASVHACT